MSQFTRDPAAFQGEGALVHWNAPQGYLTYFFVLCTSLICSFWNISGGRKGDNFPPSSDSTLRWRETEADPRLLSLAASFVFPGIREAGAKANLVPSKAAHSAPALPLPCLSLSSSISVGFGSVAEALQRTYSNARRVPIPKSGQPKSLIPPAISWEHPTVPGGGGAVLLPLSVLCWFSLCP